LSKRHWVRRGKCLRLKIVGNPRNGTTALNDNLKAYSRCRISWYTKQQITRFIEVGVDIIELGFQNDNLGIPYSKTDHIEGNTTTDLH
jgi:hypothetical protein